MIEQKTIDKKQLWFGIGMIAVALLEIGQVFIFQMDIQRCHQAVMSLLLNMIVSSAFGALFILGTLYYLEENQKHKYIEVMMAMLGFGVAIAVILCFTQLIYAVHIIQMILSFLLLPMYYVIYRLIRIKKWGVLIPSLVTNFAGFSYIFFKDNLAQGDAFFIAYAMLYSLVGIGFIRMTNEKPDRMIKKGVAVLIMIVSIVSVLVLSGMIVVRSIEDYEGEEAEQKIEAFLEKALPEDAKRVKMRYIEKVSFTYTTYMTFQVPKDQAKSWLESGVNSINPDLGSYYHWDYAQYDAFVRNSLWYDCELDFADEAIIRKEKYVFDPDWWWESFDKELAGCQINEGGYGSDILVVYYDFSDDETATLWFFGMRE